MLNFTYHCSDQVSNYFDHGKPANYFNPDLWDFFDPGRSAAAIDWMRPCLAQVDTRRV
jgi:hypothetical protein